MGEADNEIAALKARLAALERDRIPPEPAPPPAWRPPPKRVSRWPIYLAAAALTFALLSQIGKKDPPATAAAAPAIAAHCDEAWSGMVYAAARRTGVIRGVDMNRQDGVVVLVSGSSWRRMTFEEQQQLAAAVDCAISTNDGYLSALRFRVDRSGDDLWALKATDLLKLREEGWALAPAPQKAGR